MARSFASDEAGRSDGGRVRIDWEIAETHLDEAEYLASAFDQDLDAHHSTIHEVAANSEERLLAHVDGLVLLGQSAVERLLTPAIKEGATSRAQAAALALLLSEHADGLDLLWPSALNAEDRRPFFRALALAERLPDARLTERLGRDGAAIDAALLGALSARGAGAGPQLTPALKARDVGLVAAALEVARYTAPEFTDAALLRRVQFSVTTPAALTLGAQQGLQAAWQRIRVEAATTGPVQQRALELLAVSDSPDHWARLFEVFEDPQCRAKALWALGFVATREVLELCLSLLEHTTLGGLAAEALIAATGMRPDQEKLLATKAEENDSLPPLEQDDLEAELAPKVEDQLPRLDPEATARWWTRHQRRFPRGSRFLDGQPHQPASLRAAFDHFSTRRRHVLSLELAVRTKGTVQVAPWASTARQARQLARYASG
jgi:uncharacterized protein (TIGR02270 family)